MRSKLWLAAVLVGCTPEPSGSLAPAEPSASVTDPAAPAGPVAPEPEREPAVIAALSPVAFREGPIALARWADQGFAFIDGEPIPLTAGRGLVRDPTLGVGLASDPTAHGSRHELVAFGGTLTGDAPTAHLSLAQHFDRAGSEHFTYTRAAHGWARVELPKRGGAIAIQAHYSAFVEVGGALLGLRRYTIFNELWDFDQDDGDLEKQLRELDRELAKAPRGFTVLAGATQIIPALPKGMDATAAVVTSAGEIVALGHHTRTRTDADIGPARVLTWAAGASEATVTELPGLHDPSIHGLAIWAADDTVLVGGLRDIPDADDPPYLAVREPDGSWAEIPMALPGVLNERVASATRTPSGELWAVVGAWNYATPKPCPCLWRKPTDGPWELVELAPVALFDDAGPRWVHVRSQQEWIEVPGGATPRLYPAALELLWASGALWVTAELGPSYPTSDDYGFDHQRTILYSSAPVSAPGELIASHELVDERVDQRVAKANFVPGSDDCRNFSMLIVDDPDGAGRDAYNQILPRLASLAKVAAIERADGWASASIIYVGTLDGQPQLVAEASSWNPPSAVALADGFAQVLGRRPVLDCRPRKLVRVVATL